MKHIKTPQGPREAEATHEGGMAQLRQQHDIDRARLAAIVDSSEDAVIGKTLDGIITSWNAAAERLYGYTAEEAVGRHISLIVPPELHGQLEGIHEHLRAGRRVAHLETTRVRKDGTLVEVSVSASPIKDGSGQVVGAATIGRDVTERRRAEQALRESTELNRAVMNSQPAHIAVLDRQGRIIEVNDAWRSFAAENGGGAGLTDIGADYLSVCRQAASDDDAAARAVVEGIRSVLEGRRPSFTVEYPCHSPSEPRWFLLNVSPLPAWRGGAVVSHINITERKLAEERLAELLREREQTIEEVSTPVVPIQEGVLVLPLIGTLDRERMERATRAALSEVTRQGARSCIIDITGARIADPAAVANLTSLVQSLRLVGAEGVVTGVGAQAARSLVGLGLDLQGMRTYRTLAQALAALTR
jgi:PAS domain S-box-containing protein